MALGTITEMFRMPLSACRLITVTYHQEVNGYLTVNYTTTGTDGKKKSIGTVTHKVMVTRKGMNTEKVMVIRKALSTEKVMGTEETGIEHRKCRTKRY